LIEHALSVRHGLVNFGVSEHLRQEFVLCAASHLAFKILVQLIFNHFQVVDKHALVQIDVIKLRHVLLVRVLDLDRLGFDLLDISQLFEQLQLILLELSDGTIKLRLVLLNL